MSDLFIILRDLLIAQRDSKQGLITVPSGLIENADKKLAELETQYRTTGDEDILLEHESLATVLDDIQELRADLIWTMAYTGAEDLRALTPREKALYEPLPAIAAKLRGLEA